MGYYCDTDDYLAIPKGMASMKHIDDEVLHLCEELEPEIKAVRNGKITLIIQDCWVACVGSAKKRFRRKQKTVD